MNYLDASILGALQGITEFLPISSSGHLILAEKFLHLDIENLKTFDVMLNLGTLLAVLIYFWQEVKGMLVALWKFITGKLPANDPHAKLIGYLILGTIPAVILGLFGETIDAHFRNAKSVTVMMLVVACVFLGAELFYKKVKNKKQEVGTRKQALIIGVAQSLALVPGVSRSGSTIVAGLFQGIERENVAKFSFLLSIPAVCGALILTGIKIMKHGTVDVAMGPLFIGFLTSFIFGILSVSFLMKFLKKHSLNAFAAYRIVFAILLFTYFL
jgi:undecaprenyl-diphosphatase